MNNYTGHKLLLIDDEESLKKENISIESYSKEFNTNIEKTISLKEKIQKEITEIDKLYDKVNKEVTDSFLEKHEKLTIEENNLKEKLQNEVTKVKEKLENALSKSINNIKLGERIIKSKIFNIENKEQKNMLQFLSYITKINKTQRDMNILFQEQMKNLKINFDKSNINFEEYYFNGIPHPKEIEFKANDFCIYLSWKIDELNILNFDQNKINYIVEHRIENEEYKKIYEGKDKFCKIENLKENTNYQFRICTNYNDITGNWVETKKMKILKKYNNSIILSESKRYDEFIKKLLEWSGYAKMKLLYRGTRDGDLAKNFHEKCDNQGPTITLCRHEKGYIFGGYSSADWKSRGSYFSSPNSFLFTLTNVFGLESTKFPIKNKEGNRGIYDGSGYGPTFGDGHDLYIIDNFLNENSQTYFPYAYEDTLGKGLSIFTGNINDNQNNGYKDFKLNEVEVFKLLK